MEITTTAKIAAGGGAAVIGGSAVGVGIAGTAPYASVLADSENFNTLYKDKFGDSGNNKNLFVDPEKNKGGGEYRYKNSEKTKDKEKLKLKDAATAEFQAVTSAFSEYFDTGLNRACKNVLIISEASVLAKPGYREDAGRYCAKGGTVSDALVTKPKTVILAVSSDNTKFIGKTENKDKFVDASVYENGSGGEGTYDNVLVYDKSRRETHPLFKDVYRGYSSSNSKALNQVCKTAYEKRYQEVTNIKYKQGIGKYCSKDGKPPHNIDIESQPSSSLTYIQKDSPTKFEELVENRGKFVNNSTSEEWGNWSYENRYLADKNEGKNSDMSYEFRQVTRGYDDKDEKSLNNICKEIYSKPLTGMGEKYKSDAWRYCSKNGSR